MTSYHEDLKCFWKAFRDPPFDVFGVDDVEVGYGDLEDIFSDSRFKKYQDDFTDPVLYLVH